MKLNAPKKINWIVSVVLAVVGLVLQFTGWIHPNSGFWLEFASAVLLICTTYFAGA